MAYIREILGVSATTECDEGAKEAIDGRKFVTPAGAGPMLVSADYHGALVEVVRSRCVSRVGIRGIVVKDTKFTFEIITMKNELKSTFNHLDMVDSPLIGSSCAERTFSLSLRGPTGDGQDRCEWSQGDTTAIDIRNTWIAVREPSD